MDSLELKQKRSALLTDAKAMIDNAEKEQRSLSDEEATNWETLVAESESLKEQINKCERSEYLSAQESEMKRSVRKTSPIATRQEKKPPYSRAISAWLRGQSGDLSGQDWEALNAYGFSPDRKVMTIRSVQKTTDATFGADQISPDNRFLSHIERALKDYGTVLNTSTILRTDNGNDLPFATSNDTTNIGYRIGEGVLDTTETAIPLDQIVYKAFVYSSGVVRASLEFLQDAAADMESYIAASLGERIGRAISQECTIGTGTTMPSGLVTDATTTVSVSGISYDNLIDLETSLDPAYARLGPSYMMHSKTLAGFKKLKDTQNRPLVVDALVNGLPSKQLLGWPVIVNNDMPYNYGKTVLFGLFNKYQIRIVNEIVVKRLDELYALNRQVAWFATMRADGHLLDAGTHPIVALADTTSDSSV